MIQPFKPYLDDNGNYYMRGYNEGRFYFNDYPEENGLRAMGHIIEMMFGRRK